MCGKGIHRVELRRYSDGVVRKWCYIDYFCDIGFCDEQGNNRLHDDHKLIDNFQYCDCSLELDELMESELLEEYLNGWYIHCQEWLRCQELNAVVLKETVTQCSPVRSLGTRGVEVVKAVFRRIGRA